MQLAASLYSQKHVIRLHTQPVRASTHLHTLFLYTHLKKDLTEPRFSTSLFSQSFQINFCAFFSLCVLHSSSIAPSQIQSNCQTLALHYLICSHPLLPSFTAPHIRFSMSVSNTLNDTLLLRMTDQISYPYKDRSNYGIGFLYRTREETDILKRMVGSPEFKLFLISS